MTIEYFAGSICRRLSSDGFPELDDGWLLKHIDTGLQYLRVNGTWEEMVHGYAFNAPAKAGVIVTDANGDYQVTFAIPYESNDYAVSVNCQDPGRPPTQIAYQYDKTSTGFKIKTRLFSGVAVGNVQVSWFTILAFNE